MSPRRRPVQAILFDFVGVLLLPRKDNLPIPIVEAIDTDIGCVINDAQFKANTLQNYNLSDAEFENILKAIVDKYVPYRALWNLLPQLRKHYKLAIINNGTWLTYPLFNAKFGIEKHFDAFISSAQEGVCKPNQRIFLRGCQRLDVAAEKCLFMDDAEENIASAKRLGMQAIHWPDHLTGFKRLLAFLEFPTKPARSAVPRGEESTPKGHAA